ncbi:VanW family protein [Pseudonocardia petroleophila]|nr:VanW family protein [Pseudonocardia petroleophila]
MPERQSSPGEATTRPETDGSTNGSSTHENGSPGNGVPVNGDARPAGIPDAGRPGDGAPVADQVAEQVAAEPEAVDPAPAGPGDEVPDGGEPVMTGDRAVDIAEDTRAGDAPAAAARPAPQSLFDPITPPGDGPSMHPAAPGAAPSVQAPSAQSPSTQAPPAQSPSAQTPSAQPPSAQSPSAQTPSREPVAPAAAPGAADPAPEAGGRVDEPDRSGVEATTTAVPAATPRPRPRPTPAPVADPARPEAPDAEEGPTRPTPRPDTDGPTVAVAAAAATPAATPDAPPAETDPAHTERTPNWDSEATQVIPISTGAAAAEPSASGPTDPPTERIPVAAAAAAPPSRPSDGGPPSGGRSRRRLPLLIVAAVVAVLALVYVADLLLSSGSVPRGVTVAGVAVGGMSLADAEQELRTEIEPRTTVPVEVTAGEVTTQIDPVTAGLAVDWAGTLARAGEQPLNPITRITSFFTQREIGVATTVDRAAVDGALGELLPIVDKVPVEGTVRFEGVTPVAVDPVPGQHLDQPAAVDVLSRDWASGRPVALPLIPLPAKTTPEDVANAIEEVAGPAVSGPVTVIGENDSEGVLEPAVIAESLTFEPGEAGGLEPVLNPTVVTDALDDQLAGSEREPVDASLDFSTTPATVVPSQDGRGVDYDATLADLLTVLTGTGPRQITAVYADQPAEVTTEELQSLGSAGVISEFQTGGFAADSGINIRRAAELINGMVVAPGETFSLDAASGPRTAANGYVEAGVIDNGQPARGIAGGASQVSTTLFNAAYFAGMTDIEHRAHSFYISRYPPGREATISDGTIDMRFRNDTPTAVLIQTVWTPSSITVRLLGTKYYEVESLTGPRTNPTSPNTVNVPAGEDCNPSQGAPGFTITDTRRLTDVRTGEVRTEPTTTTRYNPSPRVVCE